MALLILTLSAQIVLDRSLTINQRLSDGFAVAGIAVLLSISVNRVKCHLSKVGLMSFLFCIMPNPVAVTQFCSLFTLTQYQKYWHGSESWIVRLTLLVRVQVKARGHQVH